MSMSVNGPTPYYSDALSTAVAESSTIYTQLDTLTTQAGDGLISNTFAGLGAGMATAIALNPALASNQAYQNTIGAATGTMGVAQTALTQISSIASTFYADTNDLNGLDPSEVDSIAASARDALSQVADLLDTTDGGDYVFAGQDNANPPVPDPDQITSSGFFTQIAAAVGALATNGASATTASLLAIGASNVTGTSPFSAALSRPAAAVNALRPSVATGDGGSVISGIMASANSDITSTGSVTTGSYIRDILTNLAAMASLSSSQVNDTGFSDLVTSIHTSLGDAITALNQDAGVMGDRQTALTTTQTTLTQTATAMQSQLSTAQDVDMAATLSKLTQVQTQLTASYQIIAGLQGLSLTKFLVA
jgi:flagellar hook-associated protein 3 FlgL